MTDLNVLEGNRRNTIVDIFTAAGLCIAAYLVIVGLLTVVGTLTGSTRVISIAGLGWWLACLTAYGAAASGKRVLALLGKLVAPFLERLKDVTESGSAASPLTPLLGLLQRGAVGLAFVVDHFCYITMGAAGASAKLLTDLHVWLQRGGFDVARAALWDLVAHPGLHTLYVVAPLLFGLAAQCLKKLKASFGERNWSVRGVKVMSSFELVRGVMVLGAGLWGAEAFRAADTWFGDSALMALVAGWSADKQQAAASLYRIMGTTFSLVVLFAVPIGILWLLLFTRMMMYKERSNRSSLQHMSDVIGDRPQTVAVCLAIASLAVTGASKSGDLAFWRDRLFATCCGDPIDRQMYSCIAPIRWEPTDHVTGCLVTAQQAWSARLDTAAASLKQSMAASEFSAFEKGNRQFSERLKADVAKAKAQYHNDPDGQSQVDQRYVISLRNYWDGLRQRYPTLATLSAVP